MWSSEPGALPTRRRRLIMGAVALGLSVALGGCFRPLYGTGVGGGNVAEKLAAIDIAMTPVTGQERLIHYVEQNLRFNMDGSGRPPAKTYRLEVDVSQEVLTTSVNQVTGQAVAAIIRVNGSYRLFPAGSTQAITSGPVTASAGYDRTPQRFAGLRAARDAEIRAAKTIAEQIQTKLSAWFASHP